MNLDLTFGRFLCNRFSRTFVGVPHKRPEETFRDEATDSVLDHPGVPVGDDDSPGRHRDGDVHGVPQRLLRPPSISRNRPGVYGCQGPERFLPAPGFPRMDYWRRSLGLGLGREAGALLD